MQTNMWHSDRPCFCALTMMMTTHEYTNSGIVIIIIINNNNNTNQNMFCIFLLLCALHLSKGTTKPCSAPAGKNNNCSMALWSILYAVHAILISLGKRVNGAPLSPSKSVWIVSMKGFTTIQFGYTNPRKLLCQCGRDLYLQVKIR